MTRLRELIAKASNSPQVISQNIAMGDHRFLMRLASAREDIEYLMDELKLHRILGTFDTHPRMLRIIEDLDNKLNPKDQADV